MYYQINYKQDERNLYKIIEATNENDAQANFWACYSPSMITQIEVLSIELWDAQGDIDQSPKIPQENFNILTKANNIIFGRSEEANRQYGPFDESMDKAAKLATLLTNKNITTEDFYKCMIALKISRMAYNTKKDTMLDCVGYIAALDDFKNGGYEI